MSEKPVVFVIGASGTVGVATLTSLSQNHAEKVIIKAGVRDPHSDKAKKLTALSNVTIVQATMGASNLVDVLTGVNTLYIVTPPGSTNRVGLVTATAESAKQAGVRHIAVVSIGLADLPDTILGKEFSSIEAFISTLGVPFTVIRLPGFLSNYFMYKTTIASRNFFSHAVGPDKPAAVGSDEDMGKASAAILVEPTKYAGQTLHIYSCLSTQSKLAKEFSSALGREIKYVPVSFETMTEKTKRFMDERTLNGIRELVDAVEAGHPSVTTGDPGLFKRITGEDPMTLREWVTKYSSVFAT